MLIELNKIGICHDFCTESQRFAYRCWSLGYTPITLDGYCYASIINATWRYKMLQKNNEVFIIDMRTRNTHYVTAKIKWSRLRYLLERMEINYDSYSVLPEN